MDENNITKGGRFYSAGCLPLLFVWLLLDLIGKTVIWGIVSLCGGEVPGLATVIKWTAYSIFIPLGAIFLAVFIWILHVYISERISNFFRKEEEKENENKKIEDQGKDET